MLTLVRLLMDTAAPTIPTTPPKPLPTTDTHALLAFMGDCSDASVVEDVVGCLFAVTQPVAACGAVASQAVVDAGGALLFLPLLGQPSPLLQVLALRLIGQFGTNAGHHPPGFWPAVQDAVQRLPLSGEVCAALCAWLDGPLQCQVRWYWVQDLLSTCVVCFGDCVCKNVHE